MNHGEAANTASRTRGDGPGSSGEADDAQVATSRCEPAMATVPPPPGSTGAR